MFNWAQCYIHNTCSVDFCCKYCAVGDKPPVVFSLYLEFQKQVGNGFFWLAPPRSTTVTPWAAENCSGYGHLRPPHQIVIITFSHSTATCLDPGTASCTVTIVTAEVRFCCVDHFKDIFSRGILINWWNTAACVSQCKDRLKSHTLGLANIKINGKSLFIIWVYI